MSTPRAPNPDPAPARGPARRGPACLATAWLGALALAACRTPRTEIVVVIDTDLGYGPGETLEGIAVVVRSGGVERLRRVEPLGPEGSGRVALPATLGILPRGDSAGESVTVEVYGCGGGGCPEADPVAGAVVAQRAEVVFEPGETRELRVTLARNCRWVQCDPGRSCEPETRQCVDQRRGALPPFPSAVAAADAGALAVATTLAAGGDHTCALGASGAPRCWGDNRRGQLGDGTTEPREGAVDVQGLSPDVVQFALGLDHTCALLRDGTVRCWGDNAFGQLGAPRGTGAPTAGPPVPGLERVDHLAAGARHTCAVLRDGRVRCWGDNRAGQLGDGSTRGSEAPVAVRDGGDELRGAVEVAAGEAHTCAWLRDGTVRCWGDNRAGQLGDGRAEDVALVPVVVPGVDRVVGVAAAAAHTCARTSANAVWCWGRNHRGQLGADLLDADSAAAAPAVNIPPRVAGLTAGADHACVRTAEGRVWCWGENESFQLGDTSGFRRAPSLIAAPDVVAVELSAGREHTCVVRARGAVSCWGDNTFAQRGSNATFARTTPAPVFGVDGALRVVAGDRHACALRADGTVSCWGENRRGQLGDGSARPRSAAVRVAGLVGVTELAAGAGYVCAASQPPPGRDDVGLRPHELYCWGANDSGQLGDGTLVDAAAPVRAGGGITGVLSVGASLGRDGRAHTCAVDSAHRTFCWGDGAAGQFATGDAPGAPATEPVLAPDLFETKSPAPLVVRTGGGFTCEALLGVSNLVQCAGRNDAGQLGQGALDQHPGGSATALGVTLPIVVRALSLGRSHACAAEAGAVACWGANEFGQAGADAAMTPVISAPGIVPGIVAGVAGISAGATHTCAIARVGGADAVLCWGDDRDGELGDGATQARAAPAPVAGLVRPLGVAAGDGFSCAIADPGGQVYCWGRGRDGQLGLGPQAGDQAPSTVQGF